MASYFRPRRGRKATALSQNFILKRGEVFFEVPEKGVGTGIGKIKMGNGSDRYSELPYFMEQKEIDVSNTGVEFTESSKTTYNDLYKEISSGAKLSTIIGAIKKLLSNINTTISNIGSEFQAHSHDWSEVTGKPTKFTPTSHDHSWNDITGKPTKFTPTSHDHTWGDITGKPSTFAPSTHSHTWATITNKPTEFTPSTHDHTWDNITNKPSTFAPSTHDHNDNYYTETETDNLLKTKMNVTDCKILYLTKISDTVTPSLSDLVRYTSVASVTLEPGIWVLIGYVEFEANTTGARAIGFSTTKDAAASDIKCSACQSGKTKLCCSQIVNCATSTTIYLTAFQNAASNILDVISYGTALRIK